MFNKNSGYVGYSMSVRAQEAYENGEMPLSKWTKKEIMYRLNDLFDGEKDYLKKLTVAELKQYILIRTSWHHTSNMCNATNFYSIDETAVEDLTEERVEEIVKNRLEERKKEEREKEISPDRKLGDLYYLSWSGTRNHPHATKEVLQDVYIELRGSFYYAYRLPNCEKNDYILKKKYSANGVYVEYRCEKKAKENKKKELRRNSCKKALRFYDEISDNLELSRSSHIYKAGRKPSRIDYENGLENFFQKGEQRLYLCEEENKLYLERWNGKEWVTIKR